MSTGVLVEFFERTRSSFTIDTRGKDNAFSSVAVSLRSPVKERQIIIEQLHMRWESKVQRKTVKQK